MPSLEGWLVDMVNIGRLKEGKKGIIFGVVFGIISFISYFLIEFYKIWFLFVSLGFLLCSIMVSLKLISEVIKEGVWLK